jgi:hypothetical protein
MECQKCGTWNPDDKSRCWRCSAELPRPAEPRKSRRPTSQTWLWVVAILFSIITLLMQCGFFGGVESGDGTGLRESAPDPQPWGAVYLGGKGAQRVPVVRSERLCAYWRDLVK